MKTSVQLFCCYTWLIFYLTFITLALHAATLPDILYEQFLILVYILQSSVVHKKANVYLRFALALRISTTLTT